MEKSLLRDNVIQSFGTLIIREFFLKIFSIAGQIFLARLLIPSDFGIYAIIIFAIGFFSLFSDIGLSLAIIQSKKEPTHLELSSAFNLKILLSLTLIVLVWIIAPLFKLFYPSFTDINVFMLRLFSITILLTSIRTIPIALLERKIKYNLISLLDVVGVAVFYAVALTGAFINLGAWCFIIGAIAKEIVETIILYIIQPFFPALTLTKKSIKKMIKFGIYIQGNGLVNILRTSITPLVGGRMSGTYNVGLLDFAFNITSLPEIVSVNFGRVAFAGFSRIQGQKEVLLRSINKSISMLSIILFLFPILIFSFGTQLIPFVFSDKWNSALPAIYWYSAGIFFLPAIASLGQGILAIGKSKEIFFGSFISAILGLPIAFLLVREFGFVGIAITYFIISLFFFLWYIYVFKKSGFDLHVFSVMSSKFIPVILVLLINIYLNNIMLHSIYFSISKIILSTILYIIFMLFFVKKDTIELFRLFKNLIKLK